MRKTFFLLVLLMLGFMVAGHVVAQNPTEVEPNDNLTDAINNNQITQNNLTYEGAVSSTDTVDIWPIGYTNADAGKSFTVAFTVTGLGRNTQLEIWSNVGGYGEGSLLTSPPLEDNDTSQVTIAANTYYLLKVSLGDADKSYQIQLTGDAALPVQLSLFTATREEGHVQVRWRTEYEESNLGFNIYRSTAKDGEYVRVNPTLIKGQGTDSTRHDYTFIDDKAQDGQIYWYVVEDVDFSGTGQRSRPIQVTLQREIIQPKSLPKSFVLLQNYPNPFNPETWFPYELADDATVTFRIYNTRGHLVRQLDLGRRAAGSYLERALAAYWDGKDATGQGVSSGIYFYQIQADDFSALRRMVIIR